MEGAERSSRWSPTFPALEGFYIFNAEWHVVLGSVTQQALTKFRLENGLPQTGKAVRTTALYLQ